jgi:hypothetical protein
MGRQYPLSNSVPRQAAHAPGDNNAAVVTITATTTQMIVVDCIIASYDDTAVGTLISTGLADAQLKVHYQTTTTVDMAPLVICPPGGLYGSTDGTDTVITLSNPGAGKAATLYVVYHTASKAAND